MLLNVAREGQREDSAVFQRYEISCRINNSKVCSLANRKVVSAADSPFFPASLDVDWTQNMVQFAAFYSFFFLCVSMAVDVRLDVTLLTTDRARLASPGINCPASPLCCVQAVITVTSAAAALLVFCFRVF